MRRTPPVALIFTTLFVVLTPFVLNGQNMAAHGSGEVILAVSPLTGKGTFDDPVRPAIVAALKRQAGAEGLQYKWIPSDDGKSAVVEIRTTSVETAAEGARLAAASPGTSYFERGKRSREEVLTEIRRVRKDFQFEHFATASGARISSPETGVKP